MYQNQNFNGLTGIVVTPAEPGYGKDRQVYNRSIQKYPVAIVYCLCVRDVQNAVHWAQKHGVQIRIRSGGHNYEGYSIGNAVLVVDISKMNKIRLHRESHSVAIQAGATNEQVYRKLASAGLAFPGGSCPTVGVSGYTMGGGWNYFCRYWGLGCDWLTEVQIVNWQGKVITASKHRNRSLFRAVRGGGDGNFGVVVSMEFRLPSTPGKVTYFTIGRTNATAQMQIDFLAAWQEWLPDLDSRMTLRPSLYQSSTDGREIYSRGIFFGPPGEAKKLLQPLTDSAGLQFMARYVPFGMATRILGSVYPESEMFQTTGRFVEKRFHRKQITDIIRLLNTLPEGVELIELGLFAMGGQVRSVAPDETAFFYRNAQYILAMQAVWLDPLSITAGHEWVAKAFPTIAPLTTGSFVNFPYDCLPDYEKAYYGGNLPWLKAVKQFYDPKNVFEFPQSIQP